LVFAAGLAATLEVFFIAFSGLAAFLAAGLAETFGLALFGEALATELAFLLFGSAFAEALDEAFFGATVTFANLTSSQFFDFGNY
jgi:hypothetical protein